MIKAYPERWNQKKVILASASPRRETLIRGLDIPFSLIIPEPREEVYPPGLAVAEIPVYLARQKSAAHKQYIEEDTVLLTADTIVLHDGEVIHKPVDRDDAVHILQRLSGEKHRVITGVCLRSLQQEKCFTAETDVWFGKLSPEEIAYYVDAYKPYDKAGAYGIQEWIGYAAIERIEGSFYNVMGLPVQQVYQCLKTF